MGSILIRNFDDDLKRQLRLRAASNGRSMEDEARTILREELSPWQKGDEGKSLADIAREIFEPLGGVDLEPHPPVLVRDPPDFSR